MATMQHNMDTLLQSDEFRDKLRRIPPHLKAVFIKAVEDLYDRESEKMLQLIWESRQEMRETYLLMEGEQNDLRCQSRMLEERRKEADRDSLRGRRSRNGRAASRMSTSSDITAGRGSRGDANSYRSNYGAYASDARDLKLPELSGTRASSAGGPHRSAPTPVFVKSIEELRDELFKHLSNAETKVESERERQKELLEWLKAEKRNKQQTKVEKANELLEEANHKEQIKAKDKQRQEQRFKERLEEKKKLKEGRESAMPPVESIHLETIVQIEPEPTGLEAINDETSREKKEKRKKKKHRHKEDEESQIGEEGGGERKEKREKKKKHKRKDDEKEASLEFENEESKEKRKDKKKHRHRNEDENGEVSEDVLDKESEKKEKKKKHRHRRESTAENLQNGHEETAEDIERRERKKEKKRNKKEKKRAEEEEAEDEV